MNFLLSDEQLEMQATVLRAALDSADGGARRAAFDGSDGRADALWRTLLDLGVGGLALPETFGGMGLGMIDLALAAEALGYAGVPGPFLGHAVAGLALTAAGGALATTWAPQLASGALTATTAIVGDAQGFTPSGSRVTLTADRVDGVVRDVVAANAADLLVVISDTAIAVVDLRAVAPALTARDGADRTRRLFDVQFDNAPADVATFDAQRASDAVDAMLVLIAADAFGGALQCLDRSVAYAKMREQFGRPIGAFQGIKHQLADMAVDVEPARGLYWYAAYAYDNAPAERSRMASAAKAHIADVFRAASRLMIEVHGGIGYTWDCDAQIWFKRSQFDFAYFGVPARHRDRQAALAGWGGAIGAPTSSIRS